MSWYDNEWGFSNRMIDTMLDFKNFIGKKKLNAFTVNTLSQAEVIILESKSINQTYTAF